MPLNSMTGYGEATKETDNFVLEIEVKTVNNRFLKISSKIGEEVFYLQNDLEELIRKYLSRGSVHFTVRFKPTRYSDLYEIESGGGSGASGAVAGHMLTDESDDIHDPNFVADVEYTLENTDVGGTQQQGQTDGDGYFTEILGEGNWLLKLSAIRA